jgi:hypothetical protein
LKTKEEVSVRNTIRKCSYIAAIALTLAGFLLWPAAGTAQFTAQTVSGQASAVQATVFGGLLGTATTLAGTGTLSGVNDERDAGQVAGSVPSLLSAEVLNAFTYSYPDQVDSGASLGNVNLTVAGVGIYADSVMARASQVLGSPGSASSTIENLVINGVSVWVTGGPNQTIPIPGGQVVINEQTISPTGTAVVNALHVTVTGVADVVMASATAGIS